MRSLVRPFHNLEAHYHGYYLSLNGKSVFLIGVEPGERFVVDFGWNFNPKWFAPLAGGVNLISGLETTVEQLAEGNSLMAGVPGHITYRMLTGSEGELRWTPDRLWTGPVDADVEGSELVLATFRPTKERPLQPMMQMSQEPTGEVVYAPTWKYEDPKFAVPGKRIYHEGDTHYRAVPWANLLQWLRDTGHKLPDFTPSDYGWGPPADPNKTYAKGEYVRLVNEDGTQTWV